MKNITQKATLFIVATVYFLVPLFFSHLPKVLGFPLVFGVSSYERVKVELFYTLLLILIPFSLASPFFRKTRDIFREKKNLLRSGVFLAILTVSALSAPDTGTAIFGWFEKRQGILFFLALGTFVIFLKTLPGAYRKTLVRISFASMACVLFYAAMQWTGLDQLGSRYTLPFSGDRAFSTLGNPNYLAGFLLLFLPLVPELTKTRSMRILWYALILFGIAVAGSLVGISIAIGYIFFLLFSSGANKKYMLAALILSVAGIIAISPIIPVDKSGSMEHRLIIWGTTIRIMEENPERLLFGYGPEAFKTVFPGYTPSEKARYFEDNTPDRAHNIFLDILFSFGVVGLGIFLWALVLFFRKNSVTEAKTRSMILFLLFFSFNIPVLVHFLLVGLAVSLKDAKS